MKRLGILLLPLDGLLVHRRVTPTIKFAGTHLYTWVERGTVRVKCLAYEHNAMSPTRSQTWTAWSGVERTNHEATPPLTRAGEECPIISQFEHALYQLCCTSISHISILIWLLNCNIKALGSAPVPDFNWLLWTWQYAGTIWVKAESSKRKGLQLIKTQLKCDQQFSQLHLAKSKIVSFHFVMKYCCV